MIARETYDLQPRMLSEKQARMYTGLGRTTLTEFARRIGARRKIGRTVLYDKQILDAGLDQLQEDTGPQADT